MSWLPQADHLRPIDGERVFNDPAVAAPIDRMEVR